jgi:two-component system sensor histidine kinase MprB
VSLRWKVAIALAALVVLATVAIGAVSYRSTRDRLLAEIDRSLVEFDRVVADGRLGRDPLPRRGPLLGLDAQVVTSDGTVVESTFPVQIPVTDADLRVAGSPGVSRVATVATDDGSYRVRTIGFARGAVQVGRPLDEVDRVLRGLRVRIVLWSVVVGGVAVGVGVLIANRVTASLRRLTDAAEHVETTGRLDVAVGERGDDEVGRLGVAFDRMLAALARSKDDQRRLVQDAGHELRTPLTSMRTNLDSLVRYPEMGDVDRDAIVADLHAEVAELTDLVNEIVAVASGEASDEPFVELDLADLVADTAARFERRFDRTIEVESAPTVVIAQRAAVQRAVSCLLDNACKSDPTPRSR